MIQQDRHAHTQVLHGPGTVFAALIPRFLCCPHDPDNEVSRIFKTQLLKDMSLFPTHPYSHACPNNTTALCVSRDARVQHVGDKVCIARAFTDAKMRFVKHCNHDGVCVSMYVSECYAHMPLCVSMYVCLTFLQNSHINMYTLT